jgi:hypothetical protein
MRLEHGPKLAKDKRPVFFNPTGPMMSVTPDERRKQPLFGKERRKNFC